MKVLHLEAPALIGDVFVFITKFLYVPSCFVLTVQCRFISICRFFQTRIQFGYPKQDLVRGDLKRTIIIKMEVKYHFPFFSGDLNPHRDSSRPEMSTVVC